MVEDLPYKGYIAMIVDTLFKTKCHAIAAEFGDVSVVYVYV
jgi:hypothetical protein